MRQDRTSGWKRAGRAILTWMAAWGIVVLAGCGASSDDSGNHAGKGTHFTARLTPAISPVPTGKDVVFTIELAAEGKPVTGAKVDVSLEMKEMDHGANHFAAKEKQPGVYQGVASVPMSGAWEAYIRVEQGGVSETLIAGFEATGEMKR